MAAAAAECGSSAEPPSAPPTPAPEPLLEDSRLRLVVTDAVDRFHALQRGRDAVRAELVGAAARSAHIAMREAWDALEHVLALMSDCEEEREMHYQGVIPCPYCGGPPMMCACVAREAGSLDDQRDAAVALVVQREAGERALHTAGREWALAGLVAVARPIASLPPSGVLVWGAGGGYRWDGRTPAPSGVRVGDTLSWLLCPLMADAVGLPGLYDPAQLPWCRARVGLRDMAA